ncbi:MAG TPA: hypothetical protein VJ603_06635 [Paucimonas sp.]|nr:hypothetical protein [Paucimonas sp.]
MVDGLSACRDAAIRWIIHSAARTLTIPVRSKADNAAPITAAWRILFCYNLDPFLPTGNTSFFPAQYLPLRSMRCHFSACQTGSLQACVLAVTKNCFDLPLARHLTAQGLSWLT